MYERLTDRARKVIQLANQEAIRSHHEYIGTEHILLGLVMEGSGVAANVLKMLDIDLLKIRREVEKIVQPGPNMVIMGDRPPTPRTKKIIEYAIEEARKLHHDFVSTEHLLLGLLRDQEGFASQVLMNLGLTLENVRKEVLDLLGIESESGKEQEKPGTEPSTRPAIDSLIERAQQGTLPPVVGREEEVEQLLVVLGCRRNRNPLLVGPVGVGKRSIIYGLARRAGQPEAPEWLRQLRLYEASLAELRFVHGEYKPENCLELLSTFLREAKHDKELALFLPDLFTMSFFGRLCASLLSRGNVLCLAIATAETYETVVAKDALLGGFFQPIIVAPPTAAKALAMVTAHRQELQEYHRVQIAEEALQAAVELAERQPGGRCLPGSALRLLDQAAAHHYLRNAPPPPDLKSLITHREEVRAPRRKRS